MIDHTSQAPKCHPTMCSLALYGGPLLLLIGVLLGIMGDPIVPTLLVISGAGLFIGGSFLVSPKK